jgi:hypothetical protein
MIIDQITPTFVQNVKCNLGFTNFYQHFITHYSSIMAPLIHLMQKDQFFSWGVKANNVF